MLFMGEFKFRLPASWSLERRQAGAIHTVGLDGIPWPCKVSTDEDILTVSRNRSESGKTYIPWQCEAYGELLISTATLLEQDAPFPLLTELARGTLNRLRNQISIWEEGGLAIPDAIHESAMASARHLGGSILNSNSVQQDDLAKLSLDCSMDAIFKISDEFGKQVTQFRKSAKEMQPFWLANTISPSRSVEEVVEVDGFEHVRMTFEQLASVAGKDPRKPVIAGPFIDASVNGMPEDLIDADDFTTRKKIIGPNGWHRRSVARTRFRSRTRCCVRARKFPTWGSRSILVIGPMAACCEIHYSGSTCWTCGRNWEYLWSFYFARHRGHSLVVTMAES
jgi:hypothetical protein